MPARKPTLNPQQQAAVEYTDGALLVLAGAGSGKTRVITEKLAFLIREHGLAPNRIAAITFTNKAAKEMRQRAQKLIKKTKLPLQVSTFHALGWKMLRQHAQHVGYRPGISILDETESTRLLKDLLPANAPPEQVKLCRGQISRWKNSASSVEHAHSSAESEGEAKLAGLFSGYQQQLKRINAVDFDDLISIPLELLNDDDIRAEWQEQLRYVLVDEYQDTNTTQYRLLKQLIGSRGGLTAVGDDDQSIYGWRGAEPENLRLLGQDYPNLKVIKLEQNYRCSGKVLAAANQVIANNPHEHAKTLWSALGPGDDIRVVPCADAEDEVRRIVGEIDRRTQRGAKLQDFAILYRSHHLARPFERAFREAGLRYEITGGQSFFDRAEIRDLMAYLRLLVNPDDNSALLRIINTPRRELGNTSINRLADFASNNHCSLFDAATDDGCRQAFPNRQRSALDGFTRMIMDATDDGNALRAVHELIDKLNYREWLRDQADNPANADKRIAAVNEWLGWLERVSQSLEDPSLEELSAQINLLSNLDDDQQQDDAIRMMTLHAAKGLEFAHVYLVGAEEGLLPHQNSLDEGGDEEERRLMYVGITRAQQSLSISYASKRKRFGDAVRCEPSRFLDELPTEGVYWYGRDDSRDQQRHEQARDDQLSNLRALLES